jgi:hypothetical protein
LPCPPANTGNRRRKCREFGRRAAPSLTPAKTKLARRNAQILGR